MDKKTHILFISSWYPNRNNPTHGVFNQQFAEAVSFNSEVSVIHVSSQKDAEINYELVETHENNVFCIRVYYKKVNGNIPVFSSFLKLYRFMNAYKKGYTQLLHKKGKPNLIQLNVAMPAGIGVVYLAKKFALPYVVNEGWTGYMPEDGTYNGRLEKLVTRYIFSGAKRILPVSAGLKEAMLAHGIRGHYEIVPNVVDTVVFKPNLVAKNTGTRFLHVSTLDPKQKNCAGIVRAFALALKQDSDLHLNIVGDGEEKTNLQALVIKLHLENNITFKGNLSPQLLAQEFTACDALVMFSNYESFCVVVGEAYACGKPVISSKAGGLTNEITEAFGRLVEKKNEQQLSQAMLQLAKNTGYDPHFLQNFAENNFSKLMIGKKLQAVYEAVLSER